MKLKDEKLSAMSLFPMSAISYETSTRNGDNRIENI